jgi:ABC-type branched-subunit amino acid transport system ATPase component
LDTLLVRIRDEWGATIVLVEHRIDLVLNVSDVVTVLDNGSIIASGRGQDVIEDPGVKRAYLGVDEEE